MRFSEHHGIEASATGDWFDPIHAVDTRLFIDPFLIFRDDDPAWAGAHDDIIVHFQTCFDLLADGGLSRTSQKHKAALRMMRFPEPRETCLGYADGSTRGSGGGKGLAQLIVAAMGDAIARGVTELRHFEELGILNEGIGPDRISDITTTILKPRLVAYTQQVARNLAIPMERHELRAGVFDSDRLGFETVEVELPTNPATGGPVLLVPQRFLRDLPAINADDWWSSDRASELRDELNLDISTRVRKSDIVKVAREHPELVDAWVRDRESERVTPYDLGRDRLGVYGWAEAASQYSSEHPLELPAPDDPADFAEVIGKIVERFRHFVEESGGWKLLWDGKREKPEEAAQLLFLGIAKSYCEANGIVVDREVELGRGPVDFKFSNGFEHRALLEVKKMENTRFWNGLEDQLPSYLSSDGHRNGWFLVVQFRSGDRWDGRRRELPRRVEGVANKLDLDVRYCAVDARPKLSASKIKPSTDAA